MEKKDDKNKSKKATDVDSKAKGKKDTSSKESKKK